MFANLIESDSHTRELKRRSSFFLATSAAYALILFAAGIASVYAYDARLEAQTDSLEVLNWIPPVTPAAHPPQETHPLPPRRSVHRMRRLIEIPRFRSGLSQLHQPTILRKCQRTSGQKRLTFPRLPARFV